MKVMDDKFPFGNTAITAYVPYVNQPEWAPFLFPTIRAKRVKVDESKVLVHMTVKNFGPT